MELTRIAGAGEASIVRLIPELAGNEAVDLRAGVVRCDRYAQDTTTGHVYTHSQVTVSSRPIPHVYTH